MNFQDLGFSSLRVKQPITIFCTIILISSLSTYFILNTFNNSIEDIKRSYVETAVASIGSNVGIQLRQTQRDLSMTGALPSVLRTIANVPEPHKIASFQMENQHLNEMIESVKDAYGYYDSLYLTGADGQYIIGSKGTNLSANIGGEPSLVQTQMQQYGVTFAPMVRSEITQEYLLPLVLKINHQGHIGAVVASILLDQIIDTAIYDAPNEEIECFAAIIDHTGIKLLHEENAVFLPDNFSSYYPQLLSISSGNFDAYKGSEKLIIGFYNVPNTDMYIIGIINEDFKNAQLNEIRDTMGLTSMVMAFITLLAVSLFASPITRDIILINDFARKIAKGERDCTINVQRNDELGSLARSLESTMGQLVDLVTRAESATKAKSDFLARMSHEIRTPMNGIMGMTYLAMRANPDEKQKNYLQRIDNAAKSLLHIIDDILDFSKIEAQKMDINPVSFRLESIFSSLSDLLLPKCAEKSLTFTYAIDDSVPAIIKADPVRLTQVCTNLCSNAVKFTTRGTVHLHVSLHGHRDNKMELLFSVTDSGIGMSEEEQKHIFKSFTQADGTTTRRYGGTGLGLSISKSLAELMGGSISVQSQRGKGSTFSFTILAELGDEKEVEKNTVPESHDMPVIPLDILLVEDNEINQVIALEILKDMGATVTLAQNGQEAVNTWEQGKFDVILMDIQMPIMDGLTAARHIRASSVPNSKTVPIVAMTAHAMTGDREKSLENGMNDHITKPISIPELRDTLLFWGSASKLGIQTTRPV